MATVATPVQSSSPSLSLGATWETTLKVEVRLLRQELLSARTVNHEYEVLIASLFTTLKRIRNGVCLTCKATVEKLAPSHFAAVADMIDPAGPPRFSGESSNSHFSRRVFKVRRGGSSLCPTAEPASSHAVQHKLAKLILSSISSKHKIPSVTSSRAPSSPSRADPKVSRSGEKPNKYGWSVEINKVKPSLNVSFVGAKIYEGSVVCVKFSSTGGYLAVGFNKKSGGWCVRIYDTKTMTRKFVLLDCSATKSNSLWYMCFSPNAQHLAIADSDKKIQIREIKMNHTRTMFKGHTKRVTSVDFSPNGRFLASSSEDRTIRIWSMRDGFSRVLEDNGQPYFQVRFSPNGRYIAAANDDGILRMWNARTGQLVARWRAHDVVRGLVFRPDGMGVFTVSDSPDRATYCNITDLLGRTKFKEFTQSEEIPKHGTQVDNGVCLNYSPNGQWLVWVRSHDRPLHIFDTSDDGNFKLQYTLKRMQISSTDFSPTGELLAVGSADGQLSLWRYGASVAI